MSLSSSGFRTRNEKPTVPQQIACPRRSASSMIVVKKAARPSHFAKPGDIEKVK
jgi:hypothetical protein